MAEYMASCIGARIQYVYRFRAGGIYRSCKRPTVVEVLASRLILSLCVAQIIR